MNVRVSVPGRKLKRTQPGNRKMAAQSERGADEDGGGPEWGGWSLIKMFFN